MRRIYDYKNKKYEFEYHTNGKLIDVVFNEVFVDEDYKEGLDYISKIDNPVVLDLGAFIGITPLYFKQKQDATIFAVEPNPYSYQALEANCDKLPRVYPINGAISYKSEQRSLVVPKNNDIAMSFYDEGNEAFTVNTFSMDKFFEMNNIEHVDLLKIDVEGAEYEIFLSDGFKKVAHKIDMIVGEAHDKPIPHPLLYEVIKPFKLTWKPVLNHTLKMDYQFGDLKGHVETKINTLFIAKR